MMRVLTVLIVALASVTGSLCLQRVALASDDHRHQGAKVFVGAPPRPFVGHPAPCCMVPHRFGFFFPRRAFPFVVAPPPAVVYAPPAADPAAPLPFVAAPPSLPVASVIEYPMGRYALDGDGVTTPYTWVWIPNPPPPPPAPPEAAAAAPQEALPDPPGSAPSGEPLLSAPSDEIYRWIDDQGVANWTDRVDKIPEPYRSQAQRSALSGGDHR